MTRILAARRLRRGLTMIESLFVLGLGLLFILGAINLFGTGSGVNRQRDIIGNVMTVNQALQTVYGGRTDYDTVDITALVARSGGMPPRMLAAAGTALTNSYGGSIVINGLAAGATVGGLSTNVPSIFMTLTQVAADACPSLVAAFAGPGSGVHSLNVNLAAASVATPFNITTANAPGGLCSGLTGRITISFRLTL